MKTLFTVLFAITLSALMARAENEDHQKGALEKTKEAAKDAGHAVVSTTRNVADAVVETFSPDKNARRVRVNLGTDGIEMPKSLPAGKTVFVVKNTAKENRNFEIQGGGMDRAFVFSLGPNDTKNLQTDLKRGKYRAFCIAKNGKTQRFRANLTVK